MNRKIVTVSLLLILISGCNRNNKLEIGSLLVKYEGRGTENSPILLSSEDDRAVCSIIRKIEGRLDPKTGFLYSTGLMRLYLGFQRKLMEERPRNYSYTNDYYFLVTLDGLTPDEVIKRAIEEHDLKLEKSIQKNLEILKMNEEIISLYLGAKDPPEELSEMYKTVKESNQKILLFNAELESQKGSYFSEYFYHSYLENR